MGHSTFSIDTNCCVILTEILDQNFIRMAYFRVAHGDAVYKTKFFFHF